MAACEAALHVHLPHKGSGKMCVYGEDTMFIANDWHAGLLPVYIQDVYQPAGLLKHTSCMLAIHNLAHQGIEIPEHFNMLGLPGKSFGTLEWVAKDGHRSINILKVQKFLSILSKPTLEYLSNATTRSCCSLL